FFFCLLTPPPPISTLFPYTTLFRSHDVVHEVLAERAARVREPRGEAWGLRVEEDAGRLERRGAQEDDARAELERLVGLGVDDARSEEHTSELQSPCNLECRLLLEKKKRRLHVRLPPAGPLRSALSRGQRVRDGVALEGVDRARLDAAAPPLPRHAGHDLGPQRRLRQPLLGHPLRDAGHHPLRARAHGPAVAVLG